MAIMSADVETYEMREDGLLYPILDCNKYTIGATKQEGQKVKFHKTREDMWNYILKKGIAEQKRGKVLYLYAHKAKYDWYAYANRGDKHIKIYNHDPFIASYRNNGKEMIKFLDTMAIWRTSLDEVGKIIGLNKLEMPDKVWKPEELKTYLERDVEVCLQSILEARRLCRENGIKVRRLYSIGQIAVCNLLNEIKKTPMSKTFFADERSNLVWKSKYPELVHKAYRAPSVHAKTGVYENIKGVDCNSLYPKAASEMRFPDLRTEKFIRNTLRHMTEEELLKTIGISRCMILNKNNKHGFLQVRLPKGNYTPKEGKYIIGTYTHDELQLAVQTGYEIISVEWSITYEETFNPLSEIMGKLYTLKETAPTKVERSFWKNNMNHAIGKLGQHRTNQDIAIDSIEEAKEYAEKNYKMIQGIPNTYNMVYVRTNKEGKEKPYYAPIIPALVTARARKIMHEIIRTIKYENWLYTDTDSIYTDDPKQLEKIPISKKLGEFKEITEPGDRMKIYGKKTYSVGKDIKIAGVRQKGVTMEQFEKGLVSNRKMLTLKNCTKMEDLGKFILETRDLNEIKNKFEETEEILRVESLYIDNDINDITFFLNQDIQIWREIIN